MLEFTKLTVKNFIAYKGEQTILFPSDPGVTIVFGENMRGKTSLLNAFRFALFGKVITRGSHEVTVSNIPNWEASDEGDYSALVQLDFNSEGHSYALTRTIGPRPGIAKPTNDSDYVIDFFLTKDGNVMAPDAAQTEIARVIPEKASRFFLFDGELLQEYEELLHEESKMGEEIKKAIERILGVPIITNARIDLDDLKTQAQRQEAKAAQQGQKTAEYGSQQKRLLDEKEAHEKEIKRLGAERTKSEDERTKVEADMQKNARLTAMLDEKERLESEISETETRLTEKRGKLCDLMSSAWKAVLSGQISGTKQVIQEELGHLDVDYRKIQMADALADTMQESLDNASCSACRRPIDSAAREAITKTLERIKATATAVFDTNRRDELRGRLAILDRFASNGERTAILAVVENVDDLRFDIAKRKDEIRDIDHKTRNIDESEIRRLTTEYDRLTKEIAIIDQGIDAERQAITKNQNDLKSIEQQLDKLGSSDIAKERRQRELCSGLFDLMNEAVDVYCDKLRGRVEATASKVFRNLTTEPDYERLSINENYGLTIVHKDGKDIPVRSAGAEHIVALSLMAALQQHAPIRGPIIMDSTFGRLDEGHTSNVLKHLPDMADQVLLLVYERELDPQLARNELKGKLKKEYKMKRSTARFTMLEERVDS